MFKKILAIMAMLCAAASWAAIDVNKASDAELDGLKGVGPGLSKRIVDARKQSTFKDWPDLMARVKGVKEKKAAKLSAEGLTVNGQPFTDTPHPAKVAKNGGRHEKADAAGAKAAKP